MLFYFTSKVLPFPYPLKCLWYALRDKPNTHAAPSTFGPNLAVKSDNAFVHWKLSNTRIKSTEPLSKMSQCRKMSNVLEERLVVELFDRLQYTDPVGGVHWMASAGPKYVERQENHSEMASGPVLYSKWGKSISNCFSVWRFRSHMGRNTLKYVRDSRMECCQEGSNNLHFNELWKALASLSIICPKKFLQQSWEHLFLIQQPEAESIWRFSTWWKII